MRWPRNPRMPEDDRKFHDGGIEIKRWFEPTKIASWLNMLSTEIHNVFIRFGKDFNDSKNDQLADLLDNIQPVGTVVWAACSPEKFIASKWGRWMIADGAPAPHDSKFFKDGLGYQSPGSHERYLPDCRRYVRCPDRQEDLSIKKGQREDGVNPKNIVVNQGSATGSCTVDVAFSQKSGSSGTELMAQVLGEYDPERSIIYSEDADHRRGGGHLFTKGTIKMRKENGNWIHDRRPQQFIYAIHHSHDINIKGSFTGSVSAKNSGISLSSTDTVTMPKTQYINAFVRID